MNPRQIKFRVWDIGEKKYQDCYGIGVDGEFAHVAIGDQYYLINDEDGIQFVLEEFTGLLDKNGNEIFDGDIVEICEDKGYYGSNIGQIQYHLGCFLIFPPNHEQDLMTFYMSIGSYEKILLTNRKSEKINVIGNIHENPELLTK